MGPAACSDTCRKAIGLQPKHLCTAARRLASISIRRRTCSSGTVSDSANAGPPQRCPFDGPEADHELSGFTTDDDEHQGMKTGTTLSFIALAAVPLVRAGDDLADVLDSALRASGQVLQGGDVIAIAQKIVSKSEGRQVRLADVLPSSRAQELAQKTGKDARLVELEKLLMVTLMLPWGEGG